MKNTLLIVNKYKSLHYRPINIISCSITAEESMLFTSKEKNELQKKKMKRKREDWGCDLCTYINSSTEDRCELCNNKRKKEKKKENNIPAITPTIGFSPYYTHNNIFFHYLFLSHTHTQIHTHKYTFCFLFRYLYLKLFDRFNSRGKRETYI